MLPTKMPILSDLVDALPNSGYSLTDAETMDLLSPPQSPQSEPSTPEAPAPMKASFTVDTTMMQSFSSARIDRQRYPCTSPST